MISKKLGKITKANFGIGGYNDAMIGLFLCFEFDGSGIASDFSTWDPNIVKCSIHAKWSEYDRDRQYKKIMEKLSQTLKDAKKKTVSDLVGTPVEVTLKGNMLEDWRVLTEVL